MTIGNFFDNVARRAQELGQQGIGKMKTTLGGVTPESAGNATGKAIGGAARATADAATGAAKGFSAGLRGDNVASAASPEATAYQAERAAQNAKFAAAGTPQTPQMGGLRGMAARAGRLAGPAGAVLSEAPSIAGNLAAGEDPIRTFGRSALRGGATILAGAGGAALGTLAGPVGTLAGGTAGGYAGYKAGDALADKLFGPEKSSYSGTATAATTDQKGPADGPMPGQQAERSDLIPTTDGGRATPEAMIGLRSISPAPGSGAYKGGDRPAQPLGATSTAAGYNQPSPVGSVPTPRGPNGAPAPAGAPAGSQAAQASSTGLRATTADQPKPEGVFGEIAALQGLRSQDVAAQRRDAATREGLKLASETRGQDIQRESNITQRQIQLATLGHTMGNENEKRVNERNEEYARGKVEQPSSLVPGGDKDYANKVKAKASEVSEAIKYSLSDRKDGRTPAELSPAEHSQLLLANDIKDRVVDARGNVIQSMRDFFGNKQFNTRNLYSYMPVKAEPGAIDGGYLIHFANGNTANVKQVAGGKFVMFGTNEPVDSDVMAIIKPYIDRAKAGR